MAVKKMKERVEKAKMIIASKGNAATCLMECPLQMQDLAASKLIGHVDFLAKATKQSKGLPTKSVTKTANDTTNKTVKETESVTKSNKQITLSTQQPTKTVTNQDSDQDSN